MLNNTEQLYDESYFANDDLNIKRDIMYRQEIFRLSEYIDMDKGGTVLDIGCGTGDFLSLLNDEKWYKYGIEISMYARRKASLKRISICEFDELSGFLYNGCDLIILRGTIQHLEHPMRVIDECYKVLKPGGLICFLATPNSHSVVYKKCNDLPMIQEKYNYLIPSDKILRQTLTNFGFTNISFNYPYLGTPYARPVSDMFKFILMFSGIRKKADFAFFGNTLECYAYKEK